MNHLQFRIVFSLEKYSVRNCSYKSRISKKDSTIKTIVSPKIDCRHRYLTFKCESIKKKNQGRGDEIIPDEGIRRTVQSDNKHDKG